MAASYALPGIFPPKRIGGRWLMDGALVNPLPISAARALGARLVIAVNLNSDNFGRGTIIQDHGPDAEDDARHAQPKLERKRRGIFGAERLIHRQFFGAPDRPGLSTVMIEAFQIMQDRITRSRLAGDPPDVMISPRLGRINLFDFHRAKDIIALGAEAAEKARSRRSPKRSRVAELSQSYSDGAAIGRLSVRPTGRCQRQAVRI